MILWIRPYSSISLMKSKWKTIFVMNIDKKHPIYFKITGCNFGFCWTWSEEGKLHCLVNIFKISVQNPISYKNIFFVSSFVFDSVSTTENEIMNINTVLYEDCETESVDSSHTINNNIRCVCAIVDIAVLICIICTFPI